jgi:hypothetical protein
VPYELFIEIIFMSSKNKKTNKKQLPSSKTHASIQSHEYETMSQVQNRYGNGRKKSGSDGSRGNEGFSNH